jgi:hypothetical protein
MGARGISLLALLGTAMAAAASAAAGDGPIPYDRIDAAARARVRDVAERATIARTVRGLTFRSREPVFLYLVEHLDFATAVAGALGATTYRLERRPDGTYWGDDLRGARGLVEVVYADPHTRVVYTQGTYDSRWFTTVYARAVLIFEFAHAPGADGRTRVTNTASGFVRVDNPFLGFLARLVAPIVGAAVDRKIARAFGTAGKLSEKAYDDPEGFLRSLQGKPGLDPRHLHALAERLRQAAEARPPVVVARAGDPARSAQ